MKNRKTKYIQLIEIYNSGITDIEEIVRILDSTRGTIATYISQAQKEGKITKKKKEVKQIEKKISKYVQFVELYNSGVTNINDLATKLESPKSSIYAYIHRAKKEGNIVKVAKETKTNKENKQDIPKRNIPKKCISKELKKNITNKLITQYPFDVALSLNIQPMVVYDYLENMEEKEKKDLKANLLKRNIIWIKVRDLKSEKAKNNEKISVYDAIQQLYPTLSKNEKIKLVRFYYLCDQEKMAVKTVNQMIYFEDLSEDVKESLIEEKTKINRETLVKKIREKKRIPYIELCREFNVSNSFVMQILGRESIFQDECR